MGKLENLLSFDDFEKSWKPKEQKATKRTEAGLDILNEQLENSKEYGNKIIKKIIKEFDPENLINNRENKNSWMDVPGDNFIYMLDGKQIQIIVTEEDNELRSDGRLLAVSKKKLSDLYHSLIKYTMQ
jgi:hypothetical protein